MPKASADRAPARRLRRLALAPLVAALGGCSSNLLDPAGDVARQQMQLVGISTFLMLLIVVPVMALVAWFAWKYRAEAEARYEPEWNHSTQLELVIWAAPLLIIIALGAVTWVGTHLLDPYRALGRMAPGQAVPANARPLEVDVVALDWKWLFIYPEQGIATVNQLVLPVGRPLSFRITSQNVMNSFFVPVMAGQIYAMPGMETKLHAVLNRPVTATGISANYSGAGFSHMHFAVRGVSPADFATWAGRVHGAGGTLDAAQYLALTTPSEKEPARGFASATPGIFDRIVNMCVQPGKMCSSEMMAIDARGDTGKAGRFNVAMLSFDKFGRPGTETVLPGRRDVANAQKFVAAYCAQTPGAAAGASVPAPASLAPIRGSGAAWPGDGPLPAARRDPGLGLAAPAAVRGAAPAAIGLAAPAAIGRTVPAAGHVAAAAAHPFS